MKKAVKAARATAVVAMKVPRAFATSRPGGYLGTGQRLIQDERTAL